MLRKLLLGVAAFLGACSGEPADVAGTYNVAVTNRDNGCELDSWNEGDQNANIGVVIRQEGESLEAEVQGIVGGLLVLWLGSGTFTGDVDGDHVELDIFGKNSFDVGGCSYRFNAVLDAELDGDFLEGEIRYTADANDPDCSGLQGCVTRQSLNGTRPPS